MLAAHPARHAAPASARANRALERVGAAVLLAYAAAQLFQHLVLRGAPPGSDAAATIAFAVSSPDRLRAAALYACFLGLPFAYAAVFRRLRGSAWALAGAALISLFLGLELGIRGVELVLVDGWHRRWLAHGGERAALEARLATFADVQLGLYLPLLAAHALASLAFGVAASARDRLGRLVRAAFFLNALRAAARIGPMFLGVGWLGPIASAAYLPVTLFHALALAAWLARPSPASAE